MNLLYENKKIGKYLGEANTLKPETMKLLKSFSKDKTIRKPIASMMKYGKDDPGYGLARITTVNMMNDFLTSMGKAYEAGKHFDLAKELGKKKYSKVTDPFDKYFREYVTNVHKLMFKK